MSYKKDNKKNSKKIKLKKEKDKKNKARRLVERKQRKAEYLNEVVEQEPGETIKNIDDIDLGDKKTQKKLKNNIKLLDNLKKEFLAQLKTRKELNEELEDKGYVTIEEKLNYLEMEAAKAIEQMPGNTLSEADKKFIKNKKNLRNDEAVSSDK